MLSWQYSDTPPHCTKIILVCSFRGFKITSVLITGEMVQMMDELVPADIKESLDLQRIGDAIWQYTIGDITAYNLTIEVAVSLSFTEVNMISCEHDKLL